MSLSGKLKKFRDNFDPRSLLDPTGLTSSYAAVGAAAAALTPDLPNDAGVTGQLPTVAGPQDVPVRDTVMKQQIAASGSLDTGSEDLPGTGLFGPKKKGASRALIGY